MDYSIDLIIGDWSADGHSQTDTISIKTNVNKPAIQKAYQAGVNKLGVDVTEQVCADYEDSTLEYSDWQKLNNAGLTLKDLYDNNKYDLDEAKQRLDGEEGIHLDHESFARLYCFIVQQGNPDFRYKVTTSSATSINIGGYGLFN